MKFHLTCAVLVMGVAAATHRTPLEWSVLLLAIGSVISLELVNTAIEAVVDLASPEYSDLAQVAKDAAAAAVLVAAIMAIGVGGCVFNPTWRVWLGH